MPDLVLRQKRYSSSGTGTPLYHIEVLSERATPPSRTDPIDPNVFVFSVGETAVQDAFKRVANLADMDVLLSSRDSALGVAHTEYRSNVVVLTFQDLDTAIAAAPVIRDRVNSLVTVRNKAVDEFLTAGQRYQLPLSVEVLSVKQDLLDAYTASRASRLEAEASQEQAQADYSATQATTAQQQELSDRACEEASTLKDILGKATSAHSALHLCETALVEAMRAASRLTRTQGRATLAADVSVVGEDGFFVEVGSADPPVFKSASDLASDNPPLYAHRAQNGATREASVFLLDGDLSNADYSQVGAVVRVAKKGGGAYVGVVVEDPSTVADSSGGGTRTRLVCCPPDPGLSIGDFYSETTSVVTHNVMQAVDGGQAVVEGQIIDLPDPAPVAVPTLVKRVGVSFSKVTFLTLTDAVGVSGEGGLSEQALQPVLGAVPDLVHPSTGLLAAASASYNAASARCENAEAALSNARANEEASLTSLSEAKVSASAARAAEADTTARLKAYCPDLDLSSV